MRARLFLGDMVAEPKAGRIALQPPRLLVEPADRAELRQQIMELGQLDEEPPERGRRLRDALKPRTPAEGPAT